jgi:two-component system, LuxR family, response regulator FixJ
MMEFALNALLEPMVHLIDDDYAVRDSLKTLLESHGLKVRDYGSALDFLAECGVGRGCLVLDLHLPAVSGLDLLGMMVQRKIRLPVVFVTGRNEEGTRARAMNAGAVAFLDKPVREEVLLAAVRAALATGAKIPREAEATASVSVELERRAPSPSGPVGEGFSPASSP